jgi:hypothetical protein
MQIIKAIETKYSGYKFRSRLEARWAVYFDTMNIPWEYELEGFDLGITGKYLPDFWLPTFNAYAEVKANEPTKLELDKAQALCNMTDKSLIWLVGVPEDIKTSHGFYSETYPSIDGSFNSDKYSLIMFTCHEPGVTAARSARFEHGDRQ